MNTDNFLNALPTPIQDSLFGMGAREQFASGTDIIVENERNSIIYIILDGKVNAYSLETNESVFYELDAGSIVGTEALWGDIPRLTFRAAEHSSLLGIPVASLQKKLDSDQKLQQSFFTVLAGSSHKDYTLLLDAFFKNTITNKNSLDAQSTSIDEIFSELKIAKKLLTQVDHLDTKGKKIEDSFIEEIEQQLRRVFITMNRVMEGEILSDSEKMQLGREIKQEILPYFLLSETGRRWFHKPRGYAGDYETIMQMYRNTPKGEGKLGEVIDKILLNLPTPEAVRERCQSVCTDVLSLIKNKKEESVRICSFACGPAEEVFNIYESLDDYSVLKPTLIDIDMGALAFVTDRIKDRGLRRQITIINSNLASLAQGTQRITLEPQDYIYAMGLFDYLDIPAAVSILNLMYDLLKPGGQIAVGNYHPSNPTKALMDFVLDWPLIHRTEEEMKGLFEQSKFGAAEFSIEKDEHHIHLLSKCEKIVTSIPGERRRNDRRSTDRRTSKDEVIFYHK